MELDERRQMLCTRALEVRDVWLALARVLRAQKGKRRLVAVTQRRCRQLARVAEEDSVYVWEARAEELDDIEAQLREMMQRADRAMLAIGVAGHGPNK